MDLYATIGVGVETLVRRELQTLGIEALRVEPGRVRFAGEFDDLYRALIHLRCVSRVVREVAFQEVYQEQDLYDVVRAIDWPTLFAPEKTFRVSFNVHSSLLRNSRYGTYRIKDAICDAFRDRIGHRPDVDTEHADVHVYCYLENRRFSVGLDAAGDPLHMRGYKVEGNPASLREHLAAAMVLQSGWDGSSALHDPFCGSATILTEAALIATHTPPSAFRKHFGCEGWLEFQAARFAELRADAAAQVQDRELLITGADASARALEGARRNIEAAGLAHRIEVRRESVEDMPPMLGATIITNPPYGERLGEADEVADLYRRLRSRVIECKGSRIVVINANPEFEKIFSLRPSKKNRMNNGPIACTLYQYRIAE